MLTYSKQPSHLATARPDDTGRKGRETPELANHAPSGRRVAADGIGDCNCGEGCPFASRS